MRFQTSKIRRIRHALQRRALRRQYRDALGRFAWCQDEVSKLDPSSYYATYRGGEQWYSAHITQWLLQDIAPGKSCLDIGAAYGAYALFAKKILGSEACVVDFLPILSKKLADKYGIKVRIANFELEDVWPGKRFDYIICTEVLEHFNFHPVAAMKKMHRLLADDGRLYLSTPDAKHWGKTKYYANYEDMPQPQSGKEIVDDHVYQFNWDELQRVFADSGFAVEKMEYAPGPGANRHFNARLTKA